MNVTHFVCKQVAALYITMYIKNIISFSLPNKILFVKFNSSQRTPSYYSDIFIANNIEVDEHVKRIYSNQPKEKVLIITMLFTFMYYITVVCLASCSNLIFLMVDSMQRFVVQLFWFLL